MENVCYNGLVFVLWSKQFQMTNKTVPTTYLVQFSAVICHAAPPPRCGHTSRSRSRAARGKLSIWRRHAGLYWCRLGVLWCVTITRFACRFLTTTAADKVRIFATQQFQQLKMSSQVRYDYNMKWLQFRYEFTATRYNTPQRIKKKLKCQFFVTASLLPHIVVVSYSTCVHKIIGIRSHVVHIS